MSKQIYARIDESTEVRLKLALARRLELTAPRAVAEALERWLQAEESGASLTPPAVTSGASPIDVKQSSDAAFKPLPSGENGANLLAQIVASLARAETEIKESRSKLELEVNRANTVPQKIPDTEVESEIEQAAAELEEPPRKARPRPRRHKAR